jgi:DNA-binding NarL/FixJ family response regulator
MFTMHESERLGEEARRAGAKGYVVKSQAAHDLIRAVDFILGGQTFFGRPPDPEANGAQKPPGKDRPNRGGLFRMRLAWA